MAPSTKRTRLVDPVVALSNPSRNNIHDRSIDNDDSDDEQNDQNAFVVFSDLPSASVAEAFWTGDDLRSSKRNHDTAFDYDGGTELPPWVGNFFPEFLPTIPQTSEREKELCNFNPEKEICDFNPFIDENEDTVLHPMLQREPEVIPAPKESVVNAFIKVHWRLTAVAKEVNPLDKTPLRNQFKPQETNAPETNKSDHEPPTRPVAHLPPQFGDTHLANALDRRLYKFFIGPLCAGRTVVAADNTYKKEIAPMAAANECVKHAILSLAATYVMDFERDAQMEMRANYHHKRAVELIGEQLMNRNIYGVAKGDAVVAALSLLCHNEVVNWEIDHSGESCPKWYRSGKQAEYILSLSNPAYMYRTPRNIQSTIARSRLGQIFCLDNVMSDCAYPLDLKASKCSFPWLLNGTEREQRKIVGMTGLSPKLMHYYAKITHLCTRLAKKPSSEVYITVARAIETHLHNFWQWSDLSEGYTSSDALLEDCELDENGQVTTAAKVTELIAESYVASAQIYLYCRLFRRPRQHPTVQAVLKRLLKCVAWQPTSGPLFTAQTPMFSVVIAGLVAYKPEDRAVIHKWFLPICEDSRGNVPPAWRAMKYIWNWQDTWSMHDLNDGVHKDDIPLCEIHPWWEDVAEAISAKEGRVNLS